VIKADQPFAVDPLLLDVINGLRGVLARDGAETAHLKAIGMWQGSYGVANLVSSTSPAELSLPSNCQATEIQLIVNARVATDPKALESHVKREVSTAAAPRGARVEFKQTQSFRPGRPVPTHRLAAL
jgi:hypothetical protein